jgi:hypothetical protein
MSEGVTIIVPDVSYNYKVQKEQDQHVTSCTYPRIVKKSKPPSYRVTYPPMRRHPSTVQGRHASVSVKPKCDVQF